MRINKYIEMNEKVVSGSVINDKWTFLISGVLVSGGFSIFRSSHETDHSPHTKLAWFSVLLFLVLASRFM